ncbi:hypothetical protein BKA62DRAFT_763050 [Auriculariales sp. MPI-PUGE-AT-0066]|nr:hypothetical protein BKA62DRAFT_763050 [Auriculariales sp. MPI-PUGE-AT-0066]
MLVHLLAALFTVLSVAFAQSPVWGQCGGQGMFSTIYGQAFSADASHRVDWSHDMRRRFHLYIQQSSLEFSPGTVNAFLTLLRRAQRPQAPRLRQLHPAAAQPRLLRHPVVRALPKSLCQVRLAVPEVVHSFDVAASSGDESLLAFGLVGWQCGTPSASLAVRSIELSLGRGHMEEDTFSAWREKLRNDSSKSALLSSHSGFVTCGSSTMSHDPHKFAGRDCARNYFSAFTALGAPGRLALSRVGIFEQPKALERYRRLHLMRG